jgi:uncharacterized membrane protein
MTDIAILAAIALTSGINLGARIPGLLKCAFGAVIGAVGGSFIIYMVEKFDHSHSDALFPAFGAVIFGTMFLGNLVGGLLGWKLPSPGPRR